MKKLNHIVLSSMILISMFLFPLSIKAATIAIAGVPAIATPGQVFSVSVSIPNHLGGTVTLSGSNCSIISQNPVMIDGSASFTIKAGGVGPASITASSSDATVPSDMSITSAYGAVSFTVANPPTTGGNGGTGGSSGGGTKVPTNNNGSAKIENDDQSAETALESLSVSKGSLSPAFSPDINEYIVNLSAKEDKITIDAKAKDGKASVSGIGEKSLIAGENVFVITVRAENNSARDYRIVVNVDEKPLLYLKYKDKKLGVVRNPTGLQVPANFEEVILKINKKDCKAWFNKNMNKTILYMVDEKNNQKQFYLYDLKKKAITSIFKPIKVFNRNLFIVDIPKSKEERLGMKFTMIEIDQLKLQGWIYLDREMSNYSQFYVMNDLGKMVYYQYESSQNALQLYPDKGFVTEKQYLSDLEDVNKMKMILMFTTGILALSILGSIYWFKFKKKR